MTEMSPAARVRRQAQRFRSDVRSDGRAGALITTYGSAALIAALLEAEATLIEQTGRVNVDVWAFIEDIERVGSLA